MLKEPVMEEVVKVVYPATGMLWWKKPEEVHYHCFHPVERYTRKDAGVYVRQCCKCADMERCEYHIPKGTHGPHYQPRPEELTELSPWVTWWSPGASWY